MVYQRPHYYDKEECTILFSYARINGSFKKVGLYGSKCHKLIPITQDTVDELELLQSTKTKRNYSTILLQDIFC